MSRIKDMLIEKAERELQDWPHNHQYQITNLEDSTPDQDAITKQQIDHLAASLENNQFLTHEVVVERLMQGQYVIEPMQDLQAECGEDLKQEINRLIADDAFDKSMKGIE